MHRVLSKALLGVGVLCLAASVSAQTTSTSTQTKSFEVIGVDGNQLVVKLPEGTRELTVPDDFRFTVDGKQLSVRELKPGMKGTAVVTTKTTVTPVTVTEVKNGTVMQASGNSIVVRTDNGIKMFSEADVAKRNVKIMRHGEPASLADFHSGDKMSATIVTSHPPKVMTEKEVQATLARAESPAARPATGTSASTPAAAATAGAGTGTGAGAGARTGAGAGAGTGAASSAPRKLPKTASPLPLVGFSGLAALLIAAGLRRRRLSR